MIGNSFEMLSLKSLCHELASSEFALRFGVNLQYLELFLMKSVKSAKNLKHLIAIQKSILFLAYLLFGLHFVRAINFFKCKRFLFCLHKILK